MTEYPFDREDREIREAFANLKAELEELKTQINDLLVKAREHRSLHRRAADALEASWTNPEFGLRGPMEKLVQELRNAAE